MGSSNPYIWSCVWDNMKNHPKSLNLNDMSRKREQNHEIYQRARWQLSKHNGHTFQSLADIKMFLFFKCLPGVEGTIYISVLWPQTAYEVVQK